MFKKHLQTLTQATHPCAAAYDCARIRRLVRLRVGLYRLPVAMNQRSGLATRIIPGASAFQASLQVFIHLQLRYGGCMWETLGSTGCL